MKKSTPPVGYIVEKTDAGRFRAVAPGYLTVATMMTRAKAVVAAWEHYAKRFAKSRGNALE